MDFTIIAATVCRQVGCVVRKVFIFLLFIWIVPVAGLGAVPVVDVTHIKQIQPLAGPWAFAPEIITSSDDARLGHQTFILPVFLESYMDDPSQIVTFALTLKTVANKPLEINLKQPYSAWKLYADGKLIGASGTLDPIHRHHTAQPYYPISSFIPKHDTTNLLLYLGNSQHRHTGFYGVPEIAPYGVLEQHRLKSSIIEMMVVTILVSFAVYHFGLFIAWRRDKVPFWFAMVCLSLALRATTTGEKILLHLFPNISWESLTRVEYASGYMALPLFVLYIGALYPKQSFRIAEYIFLSIGLLFIGFSLFGSTMFFTATLSYYELIVVTFILYTLWILYRSLRDRESGSVIAFLAFSVFGGTVLHDLLMFENLISSSTDLLPYGFVVYLLAQAAILLLRYASAFHLIEIQSNNLETIVSERTKALSTLLAQRDLLLRELAHRVKNNLQFIISLLWIQRKEADAQTNTTLKTLESQIQAIAAVHESLSTQSKISVIEINEYIHKLIVSLEQLYPDLVITFVPARSIYLKTDHVISLGLIINELVTNHVKYSQTSQASPIHISIEKKLDRNIILHYNDGADHRQTFEEADISAFGLPKLGWPMIKEFIKQMKGEILVLSNHVELHFLSDESI